MACTARGSRAAWPRPAMGQACAAIHAPRRRGRWLPSSAGPRAIATPRWRCDVVCCVTPGAEPVVDVGDLSPGLHLNMLGADGPGKAEATVAAVIACSLFCDEWAQASHGGELTGAVEQGLVTRDVVTDLGAVLAGRRAGAPARRCGDAVRLHRPRHPGPRHRGGGLRRLARRTRRGDDRRFVSRARYILRSAATS